MTCGRKCEVFSRVCGYYRPVRNFNLGKQEEFRDRKMYDHERALEQAAAQPKQEETTECTCETRPN